MTDPSPTANVLEERMTALHSLLPAEDEVARGTGDAANAVDHLADVAVRHGVVNLPQVTADGGGDTTKRWHRVAERMAGVVQIAMGA